MPEYQMSHAGTKAFAAAQIAEARDVGCGITPGPTNATIVRQARRTKLREQESKVAVLMSNLRTFD